MTNVTASGIGDLCQTLYLKGGKPQILQINGYQCAQLAAALGASGSNQQIVVDQSGAVRTIAGQAVRDIVNPVNGNLIEVAPSPYMGEWGLLLQVTDPTFGDDGRCIEIEDLIPMSRIDVASSNFSIVRFILEAMVVKVMAEPYQYKFSGLATSSS
jgi:hypothetical protein